MTARAFIAGLLLMAALPCAAQSAKDQPVMDPSATNGQTALKDQPVDTEKARAVSPSGFRNVDGQMFGFIKATNGAWSTVCEQQDKTKCIMLQRVASEERPEVELSVTIFQYLDRTTKKKATVMRASLPLDANVFLPAGLGLYIDGVDVGRSYFVSCTSYGCFSDAVLDPVVVDKLKAGKQAVFTIFLSREEDGMGVPVDLAGFDKSLEALQ